MIARINPVTQSFLTASMREEAERIKRIQRATEFVGGNMDEGRYVASTSDLFMENRAKTSKVDRVAINKCRQAVDISNSFLFSPAPAIELPESADQENAPETKSAKELWFEECARSNNWEAFLLDVGENGALSGTPFVRFYPVVPGGEYEYPHVNALDPGCVSMSVDPRNMDKVTSYWHWWHVYDLVTMREITYRHRIDFAPEQRQWLITEETKPGHNTPESPDFWALGTWKVVDTMVWARPWAPILHCKNLPNPNSPYGRPDITDEVIALNKQANRARTNRRRTVRYFAHPVGWQRKTNVAADFSPGAMWQLGDEGEIGFAQPVVDRELIEAEIDDLDGAILESTSTPAILVAGTYSGTSNPSGVALRTELWPLLKKDDMKKVNYDAFVVEIVRRLYELGGYGTDNVVTLTWPEQIPTDPYLEAQTLDLDQASGRVSEATASELRGYNYDQEQANIEVERQARHERAMGAGLPASGTMPVQTQQLGPNQQQRETPQSG